MYYRKPTEDPYDIRLKIIRKEISRGNELIKKVKRLNFHL